MAAPEVIDQATFLGFMSTADNWNYFVTNWLPRVINGTATVIGGDGKTPSGMAELMAAVQDAGNNLGGLTVPASTVEAVNNPVPPAPVAQAPTPSTAPTGQQSLRDELDSWGLGSLYNQAWALKTGGSSDAEIVAWIRTTGAYADRFKGMAIRKDNGLNPINEAQYLALEDSYATTARTLGLLPGTYDPAQAIGNDVSPAEFSQRATLAAHAIYSEPEEVRQALVNYYGLNAGQIASYYLNPTNALPKLQQMMTAGEIGGEAAQLGYGIGRGTAELAADAGYTGQSARGGLARVADERSLFDESITDRSDLTAEQGVQAALGLSGAATLAVQDRAERRAAIAKSGLGGLVTQGGVLGESIAK
jgi:hypothetical protein